MKYIECPNCHLNKMKIETITLDTAGEGAKLIKTVAKCSECGFQRYPLPKGERFRE